MNKFRKKARQFFNNPVTQRVTLVLCIFCMVLTISGISWSFFKGAVAGNGKDVKATTANLSILYTDGDVINATDMYPGDTVTKTFTVTNTGDRETWYEINWSDITNNLGDPNDFVYSLTMDRYDYDLVTDRFPTSTPGYSIWWKYIEPGVTHTYTLTVTFLYDASNQDDNRGKTVSGKIQVAAPDTYGYSNSYLGERIITEAPTTTGTVNSEGLTKLQQPSTKRTDGAVEYRFTGTNPHNYINIDNEMWRIIGMVSDDVEGPQSIKVVKDEEESAIPYSSLESSLATNSYNELFNETYRYNTQATSNTNSVSQQYVAERDYYYVENAMSYKETSNSMVDVEKLGTNSNPVATPLVSSNILITKLVPNYHYFTLLYPSDYAYASSGCYNTNTALSSYSNSTCKSTNWLYKSTNPSNEWLLSYNSDNSGHANYINTSGAVSSAVYSTSMKYRKAAFLNWNVIVTSGDGDTPETAYHVELNEELLAK